MKNCANLMLIFVFLLSASTASVAPETKSRPDSKMVIESRWTGTVRMEQRQNTVLGPVEMQISATFSGAIPTLHRDVETTDLNFTDDKGTGTVRIHKEAIVEGRKVGETNCTGSGQTELHEVVVDEIEKTYKIDVVGPPCVGEDVDLINGIRSPYGPEVHSIVVPDQPLRDPDVLAGTHTETVEHPGVTTATTTYTWNLVRGKPTDLELIVTPTCFKSSVQNCSYETWLPEPGRIELTEGSVMNISLKLQGKNGRPLTKKAKAFELRLLNTSTEPGITINAPLSPSNDQLPDLRFLPQPNGVPSDKFQSIKINCPNSGCSTADVKIGSYDGGGWTMLTAEAILKNEPPVAGNLMVSGGKVEIPIPERDPVKKIATAWLTANGNPNEMDDKEDSPGNTPGDGLTAYEEYRGVVSEGAFHRLDPTKKELGVRMKRTEFSLFLDGISLFESATGIKPIRFDESEIAQDRRLNKNASSAHDYDQFAENLEKGSLPSDAVGENQPTNVTAKLPAQSDHVIIDIDKIKQQYQSQAANLMAANRRLGTNLRMPYTEAEDIANTVAHELAHGVNVNHHGMPTIEPDRSVPQQSVDIYHIFAEDGTEITDQFRGQTISGIGKAHNDESGDLTCIMAYTSLYNWAFRVGNDGSLNFYKVKLLPVGKKMCRAKTGTGINDNNKYFGDAAPGINFGNCISQIKLRP